LRIDYRIILQRQYGSRILVLGETILSILDIEAALTLPIWQPGIQPMKFAHHASVLTAS
jgi:hypothetical protein